MDWNFVFFFNSFLLGVGLAMDAFSVSLANGLREAKMPRRKMCAVAGVFAVFQALMPLLGWLCVHTIVQYFRAFERFIPWIALALLGWIGGKMLHEGLTCKEEVMVARNILVHRNELAVFCRHRHAVGTFEDRRTLVDLVEHGDIDHLRT